MHHAELTESTALPLSPDGKTLASGSFTVRLWILRRNLRAERARMDMESGVPALTFARDGKHPGRQAGQPFPVWEAVRLSGSGPFREITASSPLRVFSRRQTLACGSLTLIVQLWDVSGETLKEQSTLKVDSGASPRLPLAAMARHWFPEVKTVSCNSGMSVKNRPASSPCPAECKDPRWPFLPTATLWLRRDTTARFASGTWTDQSPRNCPQGWIGSIRGSPWRSRRTAA